MISHSRRARPRPNRKALKFFQRLWLNIMFSLSQT
jgi:hypothetical protein